MAAAYPSLAEYALIGDCHTAALVSREGSIDWCCLPRFDRPSLFARILDWDRGGHWSLTTDAEGAEVRRTYVRGTLVTESTITTDGGTARVRDCMLLRQHPRQPSPVSRPVILRVAEGVDGTVPMKMRLSARPDYGHLRPWVRQQGPRRADLTGADQALAVTCDVPLEPTDDHDLVAAYLLEKGTKVRVAARFHRPEELDAEPMSMPDAAELDRRLEETLAWWREWSSEGRDGVPLAARRSAVVLKALTYLPTGAMVAAPTTSLPEAVQSSRNWDYRYSWVRDSSFAVGILVRLGYEEEAERFRRFTERSAAGDASELQVAYGVGGESRTREHVLPDLEGWRGRGPVRVGNAAHEQLQLDIYGELTELAWRRAGLGHHADDDYWDFLRGIAGFVVDNWHRQDRGLWEVRSRPRHFVHSKVLCWTALDRVARLAECRGVETPDSWRFARDEVHATVSREGYDEGRGVFTAAFGEPHLDAALLRLPVVGFVEWDDPRMIRTTDAIARELAAGDSLIRRYNYDDGFEGEEGAFVACSFWLAEALARQGRIDRARRVFDSAAATANDVGIFAEQFDPERREGLGNVPQAMSHLAHVAASLALHDAGA